MGWGYLFLCESLMNHFQCEFKGDPLYTGSDSLMTYEYSIVTSRNLQMTKYSPVKKKKPTKTHRESDDRFVLLSKYHKKQKHFFVK